MQKIPNLQGAIKPVSFLLAALSLSGCGAIAHREPLKDDQQLLPNSQYEEESTGRGALGEVSGPAVSHMAIDSRYFVMPDASDLSEMPAIEIDPVSAAGVSMADLLRLMLTDTGLSYTIDPMLAQISGFFVEGLGGDLRQALKRLSETHGFFVDYNSNHLTFRYIKPFTVRFPAMFNTEMMGQMASSAMRMGAFNVTEDAGQRSLVVETDYRGYQKISDHFSSLKNEGAIILVDAWVWEVDVTDSNRTGINWDLLRYNGSNNVSLDVTGGASVNATSQTANAAGLNFDLQATTGNFTLNQIFDFVQAYGTTTNVSSPTLSMLSGGFVEFESIERRQYVSRVSGTVSQTGETTQTSAETSDLETGFRVEMQSIFDGDLVYTALNIEVSELVRFNEFNAFNTTLTLPEEVERSLVTESVVEPGRYIIVGGLRKRSFAKFDSGMPSGQDGVYLAKFLNDQEIEESELVIVLRPRVIAFKDKGHSVFDGFETASTNGVEQ
jgi:hypothetical protein